MARHAPRPPAGPLPGRTRRHAPAVQPVAHPQQACAAGCVDPLGRADVAQPLGSVIARWARPMPPA
eukprot:6502151-Alexandrium_andersonii.AAC.1